MKLVVDLRLINSSGIGTYLKNIIPEIIDFFDDVVVLGNYKELANFNWSHKVEIIPFDDDIYSLSEQLHYSKIIPICDLFWSPHFNAPLFGIKARKRLVTIHDVNHLANPTYYSFAKRIFAKYLYKNAARKSDHIVTVSEFSKSEILKYFKVSPHKISVVHCGVKKDFGSVFDEESIKVAVPSTYILFVGNVKPHKNLLTLLKAYKALGLSYQNTYKLVILGKKTGFITGDTTVFEYIKNNDLEEYIYFTGHLEDDQVSFVYRKATLFVFPSLYEGFGLPILEAMVCNIPVLSSDKASLPEVGGDAVVYFDPLHPKNLKNKIIAILQDPIIQQQLIKAGKNQAAKFTWKLAINKHIEIFKKLF